jgi:hypothetical protein
MSCGLVGGYQRLEKHAAVLNTEAVCCSETSVCTQSSLHSINLYHLHSSAQLNTINPAASAASTSEATSGRVKALKQAEERFISHYKPFLSSVFLEPSCSFHRVARAAITSQMAGIENSYSSHLVTVQAWLV